MKLAALGLSYAAASGWVGAVKSTLCRWLKREPVSQPQLSGRVLEPDGLWTRTAAGRAEVKVIRDEKGVALATFAGWEGAIDQAWRQGATAPVHVVSDGDQAIEAGLQTVYGQEVPHQLCHFHLLREYRRNLGWDGWSEARGLLASESVAEARRWARRIVALAGGQAGTGVGKPCVRACAICRLDKGGSRPRRGWNGRTGSTGDGKRWERYRRRTTY